MRFCTTGFSLCIFYPFFPCLLRFKPLSSLCAVSSVSFFPSLQCLDSTVCIDLFFPSSVRPVATSDRRTVLCRRRRRRRSIRSRRIGPSRRLVKMKSFPDLEISFATEAELLEGAFSLVEKGRRKEELRVVNRKKKG